MLVNIVSTRAKNVISRLSPIIPTEKLKVVMQNHRRSTYSSNHWFTRDSNHQYICKSCVQRVSVQNAVHQV